MFEQLRSFGNRRLKVRTFFGIISIVIVALATIAATGSATVDFVARGITALTIAPLRKGTPPYQLTITEASLTAVTKFTTASTVINSRTQLTTYSGAGVAGQSVYQMEAGKSYIVDPIAIGYAGVTMILPNASAANDKATVAVRVMSLGVTGYQAWAGAASGTTNVYIYPYSAGTTQYSNVYTPQTLFRTVDALQGVTYTQTSKGIGAGIYTTLDYPHENAEFGLAYNNQVSAYEISKRTLN